MADIEIAKRYPGRINTISNEIARYNRQAQFTRIPESRTTWSELPQMEETQIYSRLSEIFKDVFDEDSIQVTSELSAKDVDGWDSLTHIRLITTIEKAFKVKFSASQIGTMENVGNLVALIKART